MAEICVLYLSDDEVTVQRLVSLLRRHWEVWWADDIAFGDWEGQVKAEIAKAAAVLPVFSAHSIGERATILTDEMRFAKDNGKPILPFLISAVPLPLGFGRLNRTSAVGWVGDEGNDGYRRLKRKLSKTVGPGRDEDGSLMRPTSIVIRGKTLTLPAFVFSVSSHETQVSPKEGASLLHFLEPHALLVSAYDIWKHYRRDTTFRTMMGKISKSPDILLLDSGNYEAYRKDDHFAPTKNPTGGKGTISGRWREDCLLT